MAKKIKEPNQSSTPIHKSNFLHSLDNSTLLFILTFIAGAIFWAGWFFGENKADIKNIDLRRENKALADSLRICSTLRVTNDVANKNADTNKNNIRPDSTHNAKDNKNNSILIYTKQKKDTAKVTIIEGNNINTGTNNGVIGDNNVVGGLTMHPTEQLINQVQRLLINKDEQIEIMALSATSYSYGTELMHMMEKKGYTKLVIGTAQMAPMPRKGLTLDSTGGNKTIYINID